MKTVKRKQFIVCFKVNSALTRWWLVSKWIQNAVFSLRLIRTMIKAQRIGFSGI